MRAPRSPFKSTLVQYGCGLSAPDGWLNFDASPRLRAERLPVIGAFVRKLFGTQFPPNARYGDIVKGLPVQDGAAFVVYCSHVLEHIPRDDLPKALHNTLRILEPGGTFRLVVPDLNWRAVEYAAAQQSADGFFASMNMGTRKRPRGLLATARKAFGNSEHLWMYDYTLMERLLIEAGFVRVRRCTLGDSVLPFFGPIEAHDRFFEGVHAELAIEAKRPL